MVIALLAIYLYSILRVSNALLSSDLSIIVCRIGEANEIFCTLSINPTENISFIKNACCDKISDFSKLFLSDSSYCSQLSNILDMSNPIPHECSSQVKVRVLTPSFSLTSLARPYSRSLQNSCLPFNPASLAVYSDSELDAPVLLKLKDGSSASYLYSLFELQSASYPYIYKNPYTATYEYSTNNSIVYLQPGNLNRKCYTTQDESSFSSSSLAIDDYEITTIPGTSVMGCTFIGYFVPNSDFKLTAKWTFNFEIKILICNSCDETNYSIACIQNTYCEYSIDIQKGKAYYIKILATSPISNTLEVAALNISNQTGLFNRKGSTDWDMIYCNHNKSHLNKPVYGLYHCPREVYRCDLMNPQNNYASARIPKLCINHYWNRDSFMCENCVIGANLKDGLCVCNNDTAENSEQQRCGYDFFEFKMYLYRKPLDPEPGPIFLIITNPCQEEAGQTFCKETGDSNILYKPIISSFASSKDDLSSLALALLLQGKYSITLNFLSSGGLHRQCWTNSIASGTPGISDISTILTPYGMNSCRYEGFFKAPADDIEFYLTTDDVSYLWIDDYSNLRCMNVIDIDYSCIDYFSMAFTKDRLYYIRLETYNMLGNYYVDLKWRKNGTADSFKDFTSDILYSPTRPSWNVKYVNSLDEYIDIPSNNEDNGVYYCPYLCASCRAYLDGKYKCLSCRTEYGLNEEDSTCHKCPDLSTKCEYKQNKLISIACKDNSLAFGNACYCIKDYYNVYNTCVRSECSIRLSVIYNESPDLLLLDVIEECNSSDTWICESDKFRRTEVFQESSDIRIEASKVYLLSILSLEQGVLSFEYWNSNDYSSILSISNKQSVDSDLSEYASGVGRYQGYVRFPYTGVLNFSIESNTEVNIYIQDDRNRVNLYTTSEFSGYFSQDSVYFLRIDFLITSSTQFSIQVSLEDLVFVLSSENFYYPIRASSSPIYINSCDMSFSFSTKDEITEIQFCPDLCKKCTQQIVGLYNQIFSPYICVECKESAYLENGICICRSGLVYNSESEECRIEFCNEYNKNFICTQCEDFFKLEEGACTYDAQEFEFDDKSCTIKELLLNITPSTNKIDLVFNKVLIKDLTTDTISLVIPDTEIQKLLKYEFKILANRIAYSYEFLYPVDIDRPVQIDLILSNAITDTQNISLSTYIYQVELLIMFEYPINPENQNSEDNQTNEETQEKDDKSSMNPITETLKETTGVGVVVAGSVSLGLSMISSSPDSFLLLLNTLQIFSFIPMLNVKLSIRVKEICLGLDTVSFYPRIMNVMEYFLYKEVHEMTERYTDFGYETSQFLLNSGKQISILIQIIVYYVILKLFHRLIVNKLIDSRFKRVYIKILGIFEYGMFVGFVIQGYREETAPRQRKTSVIEIT